MTRQNRRSWRLESSVAISVLVAAVAVVLPQSPAAGSMPGANGELLIQGYVDGTSGLFLVDLDTLATTRLPIETAEPFELYEAAWSPNGAEIAFTRRNTDTNEDGLWLYEMATGTASLLRLADEDDEFGPVSWSPSGTEIAVGTFHHTGSDHEASITRVTSDGALVDRIDLGSDFVWAVKWSPTRPEILLWLGWRDERVGESVCLLSLDPSLVDCMAEDGRVPDWSPGGEQIALGLNPGSLVIVDRTGGLIHEFDPPLDAIAPTWSPDGRFIANFHYIGEPEFGAYSVDLIDLDTLQSHRYVIGMPHALNMWWRPIRPASGFLDVSDESVFSGDVVWLNNLGYTHGCNPPIASQFCPNQPATRGQLAALLHRALGDSFIPAHSAAEFTDTATSVFAADIAWLSATGITKGCNPPANDRFCPDGLVTRGEIAAFLVRGLGLTDDGGGDLFVDDDGSVFEHQIDRLASAGITRGCGSNDSPPEFCPNDLVTRAQLAAFLHRALG